MATTDQFKSFLKKNQPQQGKQVNWDKRKTDWLKSLDKLFGLVEQWLGEYKPLLTISRKDVDLNEDYIGKYRAKRLDILIGDHIVSLVPVGTLIIGSYGRVDLQGPRSTVLLVEPKWNKWQIFERSTRRYTDLTEETLKTLLQQVV